MRYGFDPEPVFSDLEIIFERLIVLGHEVPESFGVIQPILYYMLSTPLEEHPGRIEMVNYYSELKEEWLEAVEKKGEET